MKQIILKISLLSILTFIGCAKKKPAESPPSPVTVAKVQQKTTPLEIKSFGTAKAYAAIEIKSQITGILTQAHFEEGKFVKKGQLLIIIDPRPSEAALKQAKANFEKDTVQLKNAERDLVRQADLFKKGYISQNDYDNSQTAVDALRATVEADAAVVENAKLQLEYCFINSPVDGIAGMLQVDVGNLVKLNDVTIVTVNQIQPIYVVFTVPQEHLPQIHKYNTTNKLQTTAIIPLSNEPPVNGWLTFVDNTVDNNTGTIRLRATFENKNNILWPGQYTNAILKLVDEPDAIVIPSQAIQMGQTGPFVYLVKSDMTVESREIKIDRTINSETVVRGLKPDEIVVTDGQFGIVTGTKVSIKNAPQNQR